MVRTSVLAATALTASLLGLPSTASATVTAPAGPAASSSTPKAVNGAKVSRRLRAAIRHLHKAPERRRGYDRDKFKHWVDVDHDCQDTRSEVLRQESKRRITGACTVRTGRWRSQYDGQVFGQASKLDVDHMVPLAEAWDSGARRWSPAKREAYANDLADKRTLIAVSAGSNRSKSDRDPTEWLPERAVCKYVGQWVAVKTRWGLSVNGPEKRALRRQAANCRNKRVVVRKARVVSVGAPVHHSTPKPPPTTGGGTHSCTRTSSGSCIRGGQFCPQASYGHVGYDANGHRYVCTGDRTHPHWS